MQILIKTYRERIDDALYNWFSIIIVCVLLRVADVFDLQLFVWAGLTIKMIDDDNDVE